MPLNNLKFVTYSFYFVLIISFLILIPSLLVLFLTKEFESEEKIAEKLVSNNLCLASKGTTLGTDVSQFKKLQYQKINPKINVLILGSSRSLSFSSKYFFGKSFTFGGTITRFDELINSINSIAEKENKPKAIILQLDYWWFMKSYDKKRFNDYRAFWLDYKNTINELFKPYKLVIDNRIQIKHIFFPKKDNQYRCRMGLASFVDDRGFRYDGTYFDGRNVYMNSSKNNLLSITNQKIIDDARKGIAKKGGVNKASLNEQYVLELIKKIEYLKSKSIKVITILTPMQPLYENILKSKRKDIVILHKKMSELFGKSKNDLIDLFSRDINDTDCEYIDADHYGYVAAARIIRELNDTEISEFIDYDYINKIIKKYPNRTVSDEMLNEYIRNGHEEDFLNIGCKK